MTKLITALTCLVLCVFSIFAHPGHYNSEVQLLFDNQTPFSNVPIGMRILFLDPDAILMNITIVSNETSIVIPFDEYYWLEYTFPKSGEYVMLVEYTLGNSPLVEPIHIFVDESENKGNTTNTTINIVDFKQTPVIEAAMEESLPFSVREDEDAQDTISQEDVLSHASLLTDTKVESVSESISKTVSESPVTGSIVTTQAAEENEVEHKSFMLGLLGVLCVIYYFMRKGH